MTRMLMRIVVPQRRPKKMPMRKSTRCDIPTELMLPPLDDLEISAELGVGRRCRVFLGRRANKRLVAKLYSSLAIERHAARHSEPLASFEFRRNRALYRIDGVVSSVAEPLDYVVDAHRQVFLQEYIEGQSLETYFGAAPVVRKKLFRQLQGVVVRAHAAGFYDLDLHPGNVLVTDSGDGAPRAVLFDFNKIPYHLAPPNVLFGWLVGCGLIRPSDRDRRHLRKLRRTMLTRGRIRLMPSPSLLAMASQLPLLAI